MIIELKITNLSDWAIQPDILMENAVVWSPYEAYDAAEVLLQAMKNNTKLNALSFYGANKK